jgi:hypothetical protein
MIWIAIAIQLILSAGLLWTSWQIWALRKSLKATVRTVDGWTEICQNGLQGSSPNIDVARSGVGSLRSQYKNLQIQLERISKLLSMVGRGVSFLGSRWQKARQNPSNYLSKKSSGIKSSGRENNVKRRR